MTSARKSVLQHILLGRQASGASLALDQSLMLLLFNNQSILSAYLYLYLLLQIHDAYLIILVMPVPHATYVYTLLLNAEIKSV